MSAGPQSTARTMLDKVWSQHSILEREDGETLLMEALHVYTGLIERVMAQSTPSECDKMGGMMERISDMLKAAE